MLELLDLYVELAVSTPPPEDLKGDEVAAYYQVRARERVVYYHAKRELI